MDNVDSAALRILFVAHAVAAGDPHESHERAIRGCAKELGVQWDVPGEDLAELFSEVMNEASRRLGRRLGLHLWARDSHPHPPHIAGMAKGEES